MDSDRLVASVVALLETDFEVEAVLRIENQGQAGTVCRQAQSGIVHQRIAEELRRLIVCGHVVIEIVCQVEPAGGHRQVFARKVPS